MALAPFFEKITQSAGSLLAGFDPEVFRSYMSNQRVALAFDSAEQPEARAALELALDLLARFYPTVDVVPLRSDRDQELVATQLLKTARRINPAIDGSSTFSAATTAALVVGNLHAPWYGVTPTIYVGSDGWVVKISREHPVGSGNSTNPFGAGAAAAFGAANLFRVVFAAQLKRGDLDRQVRLSLIDYDVSSANPPNPALPEQIELGETFLVGVGAVGHGAVWAWRRTPGLCGTLHLVDGEGYDGTNAQRYVETTVSGMPHLKVDHGTTLLQSGLSASLNVIAHPKVWDEYLAERADWRLERIALALDSAEDRIFAQSSLPQMILNSWTQADNLGVSRHDFLSTACVACLYLPTTERPDLDDLVASALNFVGEEGLRLVREYLDTERPLDHAILARIASQTGLSENALFSFDGAPLLALYHQAACGGTIIRLGGHLGDGAGRVEVPMAFQSALAGILLASEVVIDAAHLRSQGLPVRTEIDLSRPLEGTLCTPELKHPSGRCICQDTDFTDAYKAKYKPSALEHILQS